MEQVSGLVARNFGAVGGELLVGGVPITQIVSEFGTPLFVYTADVLDRTWALLRRTYPARFSISYSVKANPNLALVQRFVSKGCGLEVASSGEIALARAAGCPSTEILFAGPGKTDAELEHALVERIGEIHVESLTEAMRISSIAGRLGVKAPVALRVNPVADAQGGAMRMGGKPAPFGIDEERLGETVEKVMSDPALELRGLHLFAGTQILNHEVLLRQYRKGIELARGVSRQVSRSLATLDFGGGLGIPYFPTERELDMNALRAGLEQLLEEAQDDLLLQQTRFVIEPGRYLVGEAGIYVTRVVDVKVSRGKTFIIVDGGMNHHLAASGNLGQVIKRSFPIAILNKIEKDGGEPADVVGPLCTPLDTLGREVQLPAAEVNDLIGIFQSGAYGLTASPIDFLSHPTPAEVLVDRGRTHEIRRRGDRVQRSP